MIGVAVWQSKPNKMQLVSHPKRCSTLASPHPPPSPRNFVKNIYNIKFPPKLEPHRNIAGLSDLLVVTSLYSVVMKSIALGGIRPRLSIVSHFGLRECLLNVFLLNIKSEDKGVVEWSHVKYVK